MLIIGGRLTIDLQEKSKKSKIFSLFKKTGLVDGRAGFKIPVRRPVLTITGMDSKVIEEEDCNLSFCKMNGHLQYFNCLCVCLSCPCQ